MTPRLAAIVMTGALIGLTACSGSYQSQIQGSYGTSFKQGSEALRAQDYERAAKHYAFAASSGHPRALIAYGRLFAEGRGVERDPARAAALFEQAYGKTSGEKGKAAMQLGLVLINGGDGPSGTVQTDNERARQLFVEALDAGRPKAAVSLGQIYEQGIGVEADTSQAIAYYRQVAETNPTAARRLANLLVETNAPADDVNRAVEQTVSLLEARAEAGHERAWVHLAEVFSRGKLVDPDPPRAIAYLDNLSDRSDPKIKMRLARLYGQIGDRQEQREMLRQAADAGAPKAQAQLARIYLQPGTRDTNGAVGRYYAERAIGQNNRSAMFHLGLALLRGQVLDRDPITAEQLLRRASQGGHKGAAVVLGDAILKGDIPERTRDEGRTLLETAATDGSAGAMSALGFAYRFGYGLPADETISRFWLEKAAAAGDRRARDLLAQQQGT